MYQISVPKNQNSIFGEIFCKKFMVLHDNLLKNVSDEFLRFGSTDIKETSISTFSMLKKNPLSNKNFTSKRFNETCNRPKFCKIHIFVF